MRSRAFRLKRRVEDDTGTKEESEAVVDLILFGVIHVHVHTQHAMRSTVFLANFLSLVHCRAKWTKIKYHLSRSEIV